MILDSGEEAFAALTKFANDAQLTAASLTAIGAFEKATVDGSILKTRLTKRSRSEKRPITGSALNEKVPSAGGWKTIPSWYVVGDADNVIPPPLQMMMAQRAKAHITHVKGSHPSMIQHPEATVAAILAAAAATQTSAAAK